MDHVSSQYLKKPVHGIKVEKESILGVCEEG